MSASQKLSVIAGDGHPEDPSDDVLWRAALDGDDKAFSALVRRHAPLVHRLVRRYVQRPEDGRDLTQQVFLRAVDGRKGWVLRRRDEVPFRAWLCRVAVNLGKNHARHWAKWRFGPLQDAEPVVSGPSAIEVLEEVERARRVKAAVLKLPRRQREVLTLRIDGEMPFEDVAQALGITVNNAKVHFHHAVKRLAELLKKD
jgi:RNA polymerase sigma-70 factor (ECF subfamily)